MTSKPPLFRSGPPMLNYKANQSDNTRVGRWKEQIDDMRERF